MIRRLICAVRGHPPTGEWFYQPVCWFRNCPCGAMAWLIRVASPGVTYRRCQWCGEDFADYQDEPYHQDCAPTAAAEPAETPWWHSRGGSRKARKA